MKRFPSFQTGAMITMLCLMLLFASSARSEQANAVEMELVCQNWLSQQIFTRGNWAGVTVPEIDRVEEIMVNDTLLGRCYMIKPVGFVVVPVLKEMPPVMICSDENNINLSDEGGFPALIRDVLQHRASMYIRRYGSLDVIQSDTGAVLMDLEQRVQWNYFGQNRVSFNAALAAQNGKAPLDLGPLLTTVWHQGYPYNNYCPAGDGGRTVVGCVATAAAQILAYYKWPPEGTGTHSYYWSGDQSCEGYSTGMTLTADYSDPYDWDNIVNYCGSPCPQAVQNALAELCYEVGVAFNMQYGRCGSGAYTADAATVFPTYFRYRDQIQEIDRSDYSLMDYSDIMRAEIENNRPIQYRIMSHSIVGDGWRQVDKLDQIHLNYGWGGSNNAWYTFDQLHCTWDGCSPMVEYAMIGIEPDRGVYFQADTNFGEVPLSISFTGISNLPAESWKWSFGDGDSAFVQSPTHIFDQSGRFNVSVQVTSGSSTATYSTINYITALADTMRTGSATAKADSLVEITITGNNTVPIRRIIIPIEYSGPLDLTYESFSTVGCRTDYFESKDLIDYSNKKITLMLQITQAGTPELASGNGPLLKVYFRMPHAPGPGDTTAVSLAGYGSYYPYYYGPILSYNPHFRNGAVSLPYRCGDANSDEVINIKDITYLIEFLYRQGSEPIPSRAGDVDASGRINIRDITYLINALYRGGAQPNCP